MNSNLVPTPRTDRNGKTVIRHMKTAKEASKTVLPVPAVTPQPVVTVRQVRRELYDFLDNNTRNGYADSSDYRVLDRWLSHSTDDQLIKLSAAINFVNDNTDSSDAAVLREAKVIRMGLQDTLNNSALTRHAHGFLAARSAFCSDRSVTSESPLMSALPHYLGLCCDNNGSALPEEQLPSSEQLHATLRYAYEVTAAIMHHGNKAEFPVNEIGAMAQGEREGETSTYEILPYKDKSLLEMVSTHADRVEEIIALSLEAQTTDPARIAALLDHDGHSTLSSGAL